MTNLYYIFYYITFVIFKLSNNFIFIIIIYKFIFILFLFF